MRSTSLPTAVRWSHLVLGPRLSPGDIVVDATAGNGHDTVFLARHVSPGGKVYAFDVQQAAVASTRARLDTELSDVPHDFVTLIHASHQELERLPAEQKGNVRAFMFNLGFLPGGDKSVITQGGETLASLTLALAWLAYDGVITVTAYPGHEGGREEAENVEKWMAALPSDRYETQKIGFLNFRSSTPYLMILRKRTP